MAAGIFGTNVFFYLSDGAGLKILKLYISRIYLCVFLICPMNGSDAANKTITLLCFCLSLTRQGISIISKLVGNW